MSHQQPSSALNYDPSDPEKMRLPMGVTCTDCRHFRCCNLMFGHVETDTYCDWSPSRYTAIVRAAAAIGETMP